MSKCEGERQWAMCQATRIWIHGSPTGGLSFPPRTLAFACAGGLLPLLLAAPLYQAASCTENGSYASSSACKFIVDLAHKATTLVASSTALHRFREPLR
jgi:hypothetical protein